MNANLQRLDVVANNLANATTRGYKADRLTFSDLMDRTMAADMGYGLPIGTLGSGPVAKVQDVVFDQGNFETTENPLDIGLRGEGMFSIQNGNQTMYTRNGAFQLNNERLLVTADGNAVLDATGKSITVPEGNIQIDTDGKVHLAGKKDTIAMIGVFKGTFTKVGNTFFASEDAKAMAQGDLSTSVVSGSIESSNVDPVHSMVEMISLQRAYEMSQKMVQSQDETTSKLNESMAN